MANPQIREFLIFLRAVKPENICLASHGKEIRLRGPGGEIVLHSFGNHGAGGWYFNDTAD